MTRNQEAHLQRVKQAITDRIDCKYRDGQKEHGGDLWVKTVDDLIEDAVDEVADLVVYLLTVREAIDRERQMG